MSITKNVFLWARQEHVVVPLRAFIFFTLYCAVGGVVMAYGEGWTAIDAVYFCVVTMSTVGYGDMGPSKPELKLFCIFLILVGVIFVFSQVAGAVNLVVGYLTSKGRSWIESWNPPRLVDIEGKGVKDFPLPDTTLVFYAKNPQSVHVSPWWLKTSFESDVSSMVSLVPFSICASLPK